MPTTTAPYLHDLLSLETIRVGLPGATKEAVIDALLGLVANHPSVIDADEVRSAVLERERRMSTGVGKGVGLPHAKTDAVRKTIAAFATTAEPVDFGAIDDQEVRLVFLLVGTEHSKSEHIKILSRMSRLLNREGLRERLLQAREPQDILRALEDAENHLSDL